MVREYEGFTVLGEWLRLYDLLRILRSAKVPWLDMQGAVAIRFCNDLWSGHGGPG